MNFLNIYVYVVDLLLSSEYDMVVEPELIGDEIKQGDESKEILDEAMSKFLFYSVILLLLL